MQVIIYTQYLHQLICDAVAKFSKLKVSNTACVGTYELC